MNGSTLETWMDGVHGMITNALEDFWSEPGCLLVCLIAKISAERWGAVTDQKMRWPFVFMVVFYCPWI